MKTISAVVLVLLMCMSAVLAAQTVTDPDKTYQLVLDEGWSVSTPKTPHILVATSMSHPGTQVTIRTMPGAADAGWVDKFRKQLEQQMPGGKWQAPRDVTVGGMPAVRLDVTQAGCPMSFIIVGAPARSWLLTVVSTNPAGYEKLLTSFLGGMKIL